MPDMQFTQLPVIVPTGMPTFSSIYVTVKVPRTSHDCIVDALRTYGAFMPTMRYAGSTMEETIMNSAVLNRMPQRGITQIIALAGSDDRLKYAPLAELRPCDGNLVFSIRAYDTLLCDPRPLYDIANAHKI